MIRQPASVIIAGPSGSGKSELVENLLREKKTVLSSSPKDGLLLRSMATTF